MDNSMAIDTNSLPPYYEVQHLIPASEAIGGIEYWNPLRLTDGKLATTEEQMAVSDYQKAVSHFPLGHVRLVRFTPELISCSPQRTQTSQ